MICWRCESLSQSQLAAGVVRRDMALDARLTSKDLASAIGQAGRRRVGIAGRLERHQVDTDGVENLVGITETDSPLLGCQDLVRSELHRVCSHDECRVTRNIFRPSQPVRACRIDIAAEPEWVQVWSFG